jgi:hypothetical protein
MGQTFVYNTGNSKAAVDELHLQFGVFFDGTLNMVHLILNLMINKLIQYGLIFLLFTQMISCQEKTQNNTKMKEDQFKWQEGYTAPKGYPAFIYEGGMTSEDGYTGFPDMPIIEISRWGSGGGGMGSGRKAIPQLLHVKWLSYAEGCFYEVDTELDYDKMLKHFKEGYQEKFGTLGMHKETYDEIITGFAPGGVVVVWLGGSSKQVEVGRYQGKKIVIPKEEITKLDSDRSFIFDKTLWKETLDEVRQNLNDDEDNNPDHKDIKKKLDNNPIPFGLWDSYRTKYYWKPTFDFGLNEDSKVGDTQYELYNGEKFFIYNEWLPQEEFLHTGLPSGMAFDWTDKDGVAYSCNMSLDEEKVFSIVREICGDNKDTQIEIIFRVNMPNTYVAVFFKGNGKFLGMGTDMRQEVFKIKK